MSSFLNDHNREVLIMHQQMNQQRETVFSPNDLLENNLTSDESDQDNIIQTESVSSTSAELLNKILSNANQQGKNVAQLKELAQTAQTVELTRKAQKGGRQLDYNNYKREAHVNVSDYINNRLSKYENTDSETSVFLENLTGGNTKDKYLNSNTSAFLDGEETKNRNKYLDSNTSAFTGGDDKKELETDTDVFLQNINRKLNELTGGNGTNNANADTDTDVFLQNISKKLNELTGGAKDDNIEINSSVSTEQFLNYIEQKLNNNLKGGDINNILQDSFIKGMNKGGYLNKNKKRISQQDILNRIRMSGGGSKDDDSEDDSEDDSSDSSSSSKSSSSGSEPKTKHTKQDDDDSIGGSSSDPDSDFGSESGSESGSGSESESDSESGFVHNQESIGGSDDSLSSIIVSSGGNSETPYMISDSLHTEDINLVSFSPKVMNRSSKKSSKKSKKSKK
jgi:hypothetical protein